MVVLFSTMMMCLVIIVGNIYTSYFLTIAKRQFNYRLACRLSLDQDDVHAGVDKRLVDLRIMLA